MCCSVLQCVAECCSVRSVDDRVGDIHVVELVTDWGHGNGDRVRDTANCR